MTAYQPGLSRRPARPLVIKGMYGLGDNIMQRPFVRAAADREGQVFLQTPWPELYADLPKVKPVRSMTRLRTQQKNERRAAPQLWARCPTGARIAKISYGHAALEQGTIYQAMDACLPLAGAPFVMDLPRFRTRKIDTGGRPLAVIRPVTARREWLNAARNPLPEYVCQIADRLAATHYVVVIADLVPGEEWLIGDLPVADLVLVRGELTTMEALGLVAKADVVVGGVGWIVPASLALRRRAFIVLGGQGAHNAPSVILDDRVDSSLLGFAQPDRYCLCSDKGHNCDREITGLLEQFETWAAAQGVPLC